VRARGRGDGHKQRRRWLAGPFRRVVVARAPLLCRTLARVARESLSRPMRTKCTQVPLVYCLFEDVGVGAGREIAVSLTASFFCIGRTFTLPTIQIFRMGVVRSFVRSLRRRTRRAESGRSGPNFPSKMNGAPSSNFAEKVSELRSLFGATFTLQSFPSCPSNNLLEYAPCD